MTADKDKETIENDQDETIVSSSKEDQDEAAVSPEEKDQDKTVTSSEEREQDESEPSAESEKGKEDDLEGQMAKAMADEGEQESENDLETKMAATMALESESETGELDLEQQMSAAMQEEDIEGTGGGLEGGDEVVDESGVAVQQLDFQQLRPSEEPVSADNIDRLLDVSLDLSVELGRKQLQIKEILDLGPGKIIELDKLAGEPVDLLINGKLLAKGEVVVVDENFGVRITDLVDPKDRIKML